MQWTEFTPNNILGISEVPILPPFSEIDETIQKLKKDDPAEWYSDWWFIWRDLNEGLQDIRQPLIALGQSSPLPLNALPMVAGMWEGPSMEDLQDTGEEEEEQSEESDEPPKQIPADLYGIITGYVEGKLVRGCCDGLGTSLIWIPGLKVAKLVCPFRWSFLKGGLGTDYGVMGSLRVLLQGFDLERNHCESAMLVCEAQLKRGEDNKDVEIVHNVNSAHKSAQRAQSAYIVPLAESSWDLSRRFVDRAVQAAQSGGMPEVAEWLRKASFPLTTETIASFCEVVKLTKEERDYVVRHWQDWHFSILHVLDLTMLATVSSLQDPGTWVKWEEGFLPSSRRAFPALVDTAELEEQVSSDNLKSLITRMSRVCTALDGNHQSWRDFARFAADFTPTMERFASE